MRISLVFTSQAGLYKPKHLDSQGRVVEGNGCTNHSIRRTAAQWAGRCHAQEMDVRNAGRWKSMDCLSRYMEQGFVDRAKAVKKAADKKDPIFKLWVFRPVTVPGVDGRAQF